MTFINEALVVVPVAGIQTTALCPGQQKEQAWTSDTALPTPSPHTHASWSGWERMQLRKLKSLFRYTTGTLIDGTLLAGIVV